MYPSDTEFENDSNAKNFAEGQVDRELSVRLDMCTEFKNYYARKNTEGQAIVRVKIDGEVDEGMSGGKSMCKKVRYEDAKKKFEWRSSVNFIANIYGETSGRGYKCTNFYYADNEKMKLVDGDKVKVDGGT
jgi:hypothetical protein